MITFIHGIAAVYGKMDFFYHLSAYKFATHLRFCFRESFRRRRTQVPQTKVVPPKMNVKVVSTLPFERAQVFKSIRQSMCSSSPNNIEVAINWGFSLMGNNSPFKISAIGLNPAPTKNSRGMKNIIGVQKWISWTTFRIAPNIKSRSAMTTAAMKYWSLFEMRSRSKKPRAHPNNLIPIIVISV